jgi:ectoine hydroxylase-related dioxygenase (phytanoyl-CoA dioxygenase family)
MTLTQDQIDAFWRNGYLSLGQLFNKEEVETLGAEYDAEFVKAEENKNFRNLAADGGTQVKGKRMLQIMQMSERNIAFRKLLYDARVLDRIEDLMGPNIMLFHDQALFKPAHHGGPVPWHQDNGYWKLRPATLISCWMTLDDVDIHNGAMQVIPGSHLTPVWHEKNKESTALLEIEGIDLNSAVPVVLPAGGCMFHHCQTLHYTQPNTTDRQRRAFAMHYMQPGTRFGDGREIHVDFAHPLVRSRV